MQTEQEIIQGTLRAGFLSVASDASCLTFWVVDFLETLPLEVATMWTSKGISLVKCLFYSSRYLPLLYFALGLLLKGADGSGPSDGPSTCGMHDRLYTALTLLSVALSAALVCVRVFAIGGRMPWLKYSLIGYYTLTMATAISLVIQHLRTIEFFPPPAGLEQMACLLIRFKGRFIAIAWAVVLANEAIMMFATLFFVFKKHSNLDNPLLGVFYRNGSYYMIAICILSTANITLSLTTNQYTPILSSYQMVLHTVFATRMVLQIREVAQEPRLGSGFEYYDGAEDNGFHRSIEFLHISQTTR